MNQGTANDLPRLLLISEHTQKQYIYSPFARNLRSINQIVTDSI